MTRCRKCAHPLDEGGAPPERCPNCGALLQALEPEPTLPVALGTVWRRGAGEPVPGDSKPGGAVGERRAAEPAGAVPRDSKPAEPAGASSGEAARPVPEDSKPASQRRGAGITSLPLVAVPGAAPRGPRRGTGFYPAVPDDPGPLPSFAPPSRAAGTTRAGEGAQAGTGLRAQPGEGTQAGPRAATPAGAARAGDGAQAERGARFGEGAVAAGSGEASRLAGSGAAPASASRGPAPARGTQPWALDGGEAPSGASRAATDGDTASPASTTSSSAGSISQSLDEADPEDRFAEVAAAMQAVLDGMQDRSNASRAPDGSATPRGSVASLLAALAAADDGSPPADPLAETKEDASVEAELLRMELAQSAPGASARFPGIGAPEPANIRSDTWRPRRDGATDPARAAAIAAGSQDRSTPEREPDDLPAPVASSRPFTLPKVARRIAVPAASVATTSELETSAELDLPQITALNQPGSPESPRSAVTVPRAEDVDLDLDDLHGEPSGERPPAPAPAASSSPAPASPRVTLRPPMRPRALPRLAAPVVQPPPPPLAYVGLGALTLALGGLWWFYFSRDPGPGRALDDPSPAALSAMSSGTWPEGHLAALSARLDADRVPDYLSALVEAEAHGDRLGRAEAALLLHLRYGPDPVRRSAAAVWRKQAAPGDPRTDRVAALAALADGELAVAERLLAGHDDDPRALLYRALAAQQRGDHEAAARAAEAALALRPTDAAAGLVAVTSALAARRDAPLTMLQAAVDAHPDHPLYQQALARELLARGRLGAARAVADRLEPMVGASEAHQALVLTLRAEVAAATGEVGKPLYLSENAGRLAPQNLAVQLARVRLLLTLGDLGRVQQELTPLIRGAPLDPDALALQAELAIASGNENLATRALDRLATVAGSGRVARLRGRVHAMRGRSDDAAAAFTAALAEDPSDFAAAIALAELRQRIGAADPLGPISRVQALLREDPRSSARAGLRALALARAELLVEAGRKDQAVATLDAQLLADPDDNAAQLRRGVLAVEQGRVAAGRADLLAVFDRTGGYPGLVGPLGRIYLREGDLAGLTTLVQPHASDPQAPDEVVLMHALLRLAQNDREAADSSVDKVLQRSPSSWQAHLVKARILYERERIPEALAEIRLARPRRPDPDVELWTGKIAERSGKLPEAVAAFRRARQQDPGQVEAGFLLGRALLAQGLAREAITELQAVTRAPEVPPGAHLTLGLAYREREQLPEALLSFTHAIAHDPNPEEALYWAGRTAVELGRPAEGVPQLARAAALAGNRPWLADAQLWLGRAHHRLGHRAEARAAFTAYLQQAGSKATARAEVEKLMRER